VSRFNAELGLYLVREELSSVVEDNVAGSLLFGALELGRLDDLPADAEALVEFVRGPLRDVTSRRIGEARAHQVCERIARILEKGMDRKFGDAATRRTAKLELGSGPLTVLVISRGPLAVWLRVALAPDFVDVRSLAGLSTSKGLLERLTPALVIVDAGEALHEEPGAVAAWLGGLLPEARVLWGTDSPWATDLCATLDRKGVEYVPVDRREGVEPLLDLVRSRKG
jgi:hypothetical protein